MSKNLINRSVQNVIIWNFIFSSRPKIDSILSSAHNKNLQCDKLSICILLPENEKEIVENYSSRRHLDFKKLDFRITNMS